MSSEDFNKQVSNIIGGTSIPTLSQKNLGSLKLPLPSLPEQQHIVSIIDKAFEAIDKAIENTQKNLQNAKELFESTVRRLFELKGKDWPVIKLGEICKINDGTHFSPKNNSEGKYMYITAKNIKPYFISLKNVTFISEKDHKEIYSRCSPKKGDVLYIKDGATTGIAAINNINEEFSLLSSVALLKCSDRIINSFLVHYMNSSVGKENFLGYIDGAAITRLTLVKIKNVEINLPPHHEQRLIVDKLDLLRIESEKLQSKYQQKLCDLEELKKSVLNKVFAGEL
jgi:type I restriction enzyme S subunit